MYEYYYVHPQIYACVGLCATTWFLGMRTLTGSHVVSGHAYTDAQPRGFLVGTDSSCERHRQQSRNLWDTSEYSLSTSFFIHGKQ